MAPRPDHVLVYDGDCAMCTRWMRRVRKWDREGRIETLPLQSDDVARRFPQIRPEALLEAMHFVEPDGRVSAGAEAAERMLRILPAGGTLRWLFHLPGGRFVADRIYRTIASHRSRLGCGDHCSLDARH